MIYLDCAATSPVDPRVAAVATHYLIEEYGNSGSTTHAFGQAARTAIQSARGHVGAVVGADSDEVAFTSGATEANNLALLGLRPWLLSCDGAHILSSTVEHKAVLEPLGVLEKAGIEVELLPVDSAGLIDPDDLRARLRPTTRLVSVMHVNNETGAVQPLEAVASVLEDHEAFLHTDAAQSFGKVGGLSNPRIDLISASGHKLYAPKGVGALITRKRDYVRPPIRPLLYGGGQERGLRPGTLPVHLCAAFGEACRIAMTEAAQWHRTAASVKACALEAFGKLGAQVNGTVDSAVPYTLNLSIPGVSSEAAIIALKDLVALSNGSACTSASYNPSHVLVAMGLDESRAMEALRLSWSHLTPNVPWEDVVQRLKSLT